MSDEQSTARAPAEPPDPDVPGEATEDASLFASVTMQFYRGETDRMATWRTRLDQTTNWAVVVMAAILTWAFSSPDNPHYVLLIGLLAIAAFLFIEAERYQQYDAWRSRILVVEREFLAHVFGTDGAERHDWRRHLGDDLQDPSIQLPFSRAVGHRLQRVYFALLTVLLAAWVARITVFEPGEPWHVTAGVTGIPGTAVVAVVGACYLVFGGLTLWSYRQASSREFDDDESAALGRKD